MRRLLHTANGVLPQHGRRGVCDAFSPVIQNNYSFHLARGQGILGDLPEISYVLFEISIEFSERRHGTLQNPDPHFSESSDNLRTIGIDLSHRKSILRPDAQGYNGPEQIH